MACTYTLYSERKGANGDVEIISKEYTYELLVKLFRENGYRDFSDIVYSRGTKRDAVFSDVLAAKKDFAVQVSKSRSSGEPDYTSGQKYTPQLLIDSGYFRFKGLEVIREQSDEEYIENAMLAFIAEAKAKGENMSEAEARQKADNILKDWLTINEDAKDLHTILNSFNFLKGDVDDLRYDFLQRLDGTKFEAFGPQIWDAIMEKGGLMNIMRGRHKLEVGAKVKIVQGVNLMAKLNHIGEDIVGHIDNLVIDTNGVLHIYNYKITSTPVSEWGSVKKEKYLYLMALLKQILAHNGFNVTGTQLHIIPIRLDYSDDLSKINDVTIYSNNEFPVPTGLEFNRYEVMAKYFIKSNIKLEPIKSKTVQKINRYLNSIFPERGVTLEGIQKSVDEWIKFNYSSRWENRIKKVDAPDHVYEIYFDDEFAQPILIQEATEPLKNLQIREAVTNYMNEVNTSNSEFLGRIMLDILSSKRSGRITLERLRIGNRNLQLARAFIGKSLAKYITSYRINEAGTKEYEWEIIPNDTLLDANIILFRNNWNDQVDVVVLSNFNLRAKTSFNGLSNIMGSHIRDASSDTKGLINYPANYANIEAVRTMTVLNEVLPELNLSDFNLGELKIISSLNGGMMELFDMETLNKELFQEVVKVVKKNVSDFDFVNNFTKSKYVDPLQILIQNYHGIINTGDIAASEKLELYDLGFSDLESLSTREQKKVELGAIIEKIFKMDETLASMGPSAIIASAKGDPNPQRRALANLYMMCNDAYCYYSGIKVANEYKISLMEEYTLPQNRIKNRTYLVVTNMFTRAVDDIAYKVRDQYNYIYNFTMEFYDSMGFGSVRASVIGDLTNAFNNLYRRNSEGKLLMEFRNPYKSDSLPALNAAEKKYLKLVLFEFAKIRSEMYGFDFNFSRSNLDDPALLRFIEQNKKWYFNPPLERASDATVRSKGFGNMVDEWSRRAKELIRNPKEAFDRTVLKIGTPEEAEEMERSFNTLRLQNPYVRGDGLGDPSARVEMLSLRPDYYETNVENLLAHYLDRHIQVREFLKTLIATKGILLNLALLGEAVGEENKVGLQLTVKMILDFTKTNIFNVSIMEPESLKVMAWVQPFRLLVSKAYIAGNIVSMFRDVYEGMWQNTARMLTKYLTDIDAKSLASAYKDVTAASFTSVRNITIIDELCKTYRLSNLDVARISEGLTTSKSGILNVENWMYATLRAPDFLNRMVLFVAKCKKDGCWEAFDLEDNKLVYNWKKDKRYSVFSGVDLGTKEEYEKQRIAYYNAVRQYNLEHPENTIAFDDPKGLPVAYSSEQIQLMRLLSNSIYGAYDKSMRAKYEHTALGLTFAMFSTWMNGMVSNYATKPGQYSGGLTTVEQDRDGSGNLLFLDKNGLVVVETRNGDTKLYIYEGTGEEVTDTEGMVPVMKDVPLVVQGIWYTFKDGFKALKEGGTKQFSKEIWGNPMQKANLLKALSDLIAILFYSSIFRYAISPAYKAFKKEMVNHSVVENAIVEIMYKSASRSYDGFLGPIAPIQYLGENTNPPGYALSTKVTRDLGKFVFGDKTFGQLVTGNIAFFRSFGDTYEAEVKKNKE